MPQEGHASIDPGSRAARTILAFYSAIERAAPRGSRRRRAYSTGLAMPGRLRRSFGSPRLEALGGGVTTVSTFPDVVTSADAPRLSVVVTDDGGSEGLLRTLESLVDNPATAPCEVVVVSSGGAPDASLRSAGVQVVTARGGLVDGALEVAARCASDVAVVLSAQIAVTPGALDAVLAAVGDQPTVDHFALRVTDPVGRVLHAGTIVLPDGSAVRYCDDAGLHPQEMAYQRPVDRSSAVALAVRPSAAARLRIVGDELELGDPVGRVLYVPAAHAVLHGALGAIPLRGMAADAAVTADAARRRTSDSWVVVVDAGVPRPDVDAGSVRLLQMLLSLRAQGHGVLFVPNDRDAAGAYGAVLARHGVEVLAGPVDLHSRLDLMRGLITSAVLARATVAWPYLLMMRRVLPEVPVHFDTVDLHFLREERADQVAGRAPSAISAATRELELALVRSCDRTLVVSVAEQELLATLVPGADVRVLSLVLPGRAVLTEASAGWPQPEQRDVVFVGSFDHTPNADGIEWFLMEVLPLLGSDAVKGRVVVVGSNPPPDLVASTRPPAQGHPDVELTGWVADLGPVYARARIAPLRFGAGIKGKVIEAMACGVPVVATSVAAEGISLEHGVTAWLADDAQGFADGILRLLRDDDLWSTLSKAGRGRVAHTYSASAFDTALRSHLEVVPAGTEDHSSGSATTGSPAYQRSSE